MNTTFTLNEDSATMAVYEQSIDITSNSDNIPGVSTYMIIIDALTEIVALIAVALTVFKKEHTDHIRTKKNKTPH